MTEAPPRHAQGDELIASIRANTAAVVALTAAVAALLVAVRSNTAVSREMLEAGEDDEDDDDEDGCPDCDDPDCDGDCEPAPRRRR